MNDEDLANNYLRNIKEYQIKRNKSVKDYQKITETFENHYKDNCSCPIKKGKLNSWYRFCDCYNTKYGKFQQH